MSERNRKASIIVTTNNVSAAEANVKRENLIMKITLGLTITSLLTFLITLTSSHWVFITYPFNFFMEKRKMFVIKSAYGIIWECALGRSPDVSMFENNCDYHQTQIQNISSAAEQTFIGMVRTMLSFSVIHILLLMITFICGLYSIRAFRYTYKRLTAMLYIVTAVSLLVCIEVLSTIFRHAKEHLPLIYPPGAKHSYGICYVLAWLIFIQLLVASFVFFICGKKRKGTFDEATEEEALANLPVNLGRL